MRKMCGIGIRPMMMVALMFCALSTKAQERLTLTLEQAIEIALNDNPTIQVAEQTIKMKKISKVSLVI